ncbi:sensor histidine kinase [Roseinatronobacter sp. S2]|uniref:sensor histidine kinase n=1 Tax=Roseinatronobacter sp. S2 TaxID=3035471 RepID=UPI00240FCEF5|nr:HAMP domain-containing sensor histidine kinase [Roseinatronobacter sp. S2]WFE75317.1 HAMP domain-containing sensor histidine kinase [Roseinatronobacter sp. S2]
MRGFHLPVMVKGPLLAAGLLVLVGILASHLVLRALVNTQERHLREMALLEFAGVEATIGPFVVRDDIWEMFDLLDRVTQREGALRPLQATLIDPLGRVTVSTAPEINPLGAQRASMIAAATPVTAPQYDLSNGTIALSKVMQYQNRPLGQVIIEFDTTGFVTERTRTAAILIAGNAIATLIAALLGFWLMRRVLRPVARLTDEMGRSSDALTPIPDAAIPRRNPEVAKLYDTYNGLIRAVAERDATTRRLADRERFVSLGRLAGTLAHEVNNPLGGLLNTVDTLRTYPDRADVVKNSADLLDRGLRHMRDVVRATLDVHRDAPERRSLALADLEDLNLLIRPEAEGRGQHLHWEITLPEDCVAHLPAGPVRQIVLNLLLNASSAAGYGGEIGLRLDREGAFVRLAIQDSGPGLPDHLHPRLLSDAPVAPGGGVGLRLVRELVQDMGGQITLGQSPQGLQEIQVYLPCAGVGGQDA